MLYINRVKTTSCSFSMPVASLLLLMALVLTAQRSSRRPTRFTCTALAFGRRRRISGDTRKALRLAGRGRRGGAVAAVAVGGCRGAQPVRCALRASPLSPRQRYGQAGLVSLARRAAALSESAIGICVRLPAPAEKQLSDHWFKLGWHQARKLAGSDPTLLCGPCHGSVAQPAVMRERLGAAGEGAAPARAAIARSLADVRVRLTAQPRPRHQLSRRRSRYAPGLVSLHRFQRGLGLARVRPATRAEPPRSPKALSGFVFTYRHWKEK
mgnify:CR=1 FL=1